MSVPARLIHNSGGRIRTSDLRVMGPTTQFFVTFFKSTIYAFVFVAQGLNEIVMMTMVIMMITGFATFCYSHQ